MKLSLTLFVTTAFLPHYEKNRDKIKRYFTEYHYLANKDENLTYNHKIRIASATSNLYEYKFISSISFFEIKININFILIISNKISMK